MIYFSKYFLNLARKIGSIVPLMMLIIAIFHLSMQGK